MCAPSAGCWSRATPLKYGTPTDGRCSISLPPRERRDVYGSSWSMEVRGFCSLEDDSVLSSGMACNTLSGGWILKNGFHLESSLTFQKSFQMVLLKTSLLFNVSFLCTLLIMYSKYSAVHVLFTICTDKDHFVSMQVGGSILPFDNAKKPISLWGGSYPHHQGSSGSCKDPYDPYP